MENKHFTKLIFLNLITSANCTIAQMSLSAGLSYIFSNSVFIFAFFTGLYLMSMGIGSLIVEKFNFDTEKFTQILLVNSALGIILANPGITGLLLSNEYISFITRHYNLNLSWILLPLGVILTICIGIVSGAELPIFSKYIEKKNWHTSKPMIGVLTSDYLGAFAGIIIFTLILNPFFGLIPSILISQIMTVVVINYVYWKERAVFQSRKLGGYLLILNIYLAGTFLLKDTIIFYLDHISKF